MSKPNDLTGQRFGRLTVLERAENDKWGKTCWLCLCDCGNEKIVNGASLLRGLTISCGCKKKENIQKYNDENKLIDETGNVYGYLTVLSRNLDPHFQKANRAMWNCQCKCGNICVVMGKMLRNGHVTSCGCRRQSLGEEAVEKLLQLQKLSYAKEYLVDVRKEKIYQHHKAHVLILLYLKIINYNIL